MTTVIKNSNDLAAVINSSSASAAAGSVDEGISTAAVKEAITVGWQTDTNEGYRNKKNLHLHCQPPAWTAQPATASRNRH
jgi:hypothetical protein